MLRTCTVALLFFASASCFVCGCAKRSYADSHKSREVLKLVLDAWQKGDAPASLLNCKPPIHVRDEDWRAGCKLKSYEITPEDEALGYQRRCKVKLTLEDAEGASDLKEVFYEIDTSPAIVVGRAFE